MARIDWEHFDWPSLASGWVDDTRVAIVFFTRLPLRIDHEIAAEAVARALRAWPVVGALLGIAGGIVYAIAGKLGLSPLIAAFLALATIAAATGAMHEDGLADFFDGLGGRDAEASLAIMRDSRMGVFGTLALFFCLALRAAAIAQVATPGGVAACLVASAAASRGLAALVASSLAPARSDGLGAMLGGLRQETVVAALGLGAIAVLLLLGIGAGIAALALGVTAVIAVTMLARHRLGGYTGDVMGAAQQLAEAAILVAAAIFA